MLARVFYVGISVMNLMLVSVFWSFMLEILSSEQTKRLFGLIAAGGTAGALVGPLAHQPARHAASATRECCISAPACSSWPCSCSGC